MAVLYPARICAQGTRNVLVIHHGSSNFPANVVMSAVFREIIGSDLRNQLFEEYVDEDRLDSDGEVDEEALLRKYDGKKFDLIIGDGRMPFRFLLERGEILWPGTPKVFDFLDDRELPGQLPSDITGITWRVPFGRTLDMALQLMPRTRHVYYVGGRNAQDRMWRTFAEQDFAHYAGKVDVTYLNDLPVPELMDRLGRLPINSVVIFPGILRDADGHAFIPARLCPLIVSASSAPVFGTFETLLGCGIVGGSVLDFNGLANQTAWLGVHVLARGTAFGIPVAHASTRDQVDWRQLQRWNISEDRLPAGTVVRFRALTAWQRYQWYVMSALTALIAQLAIIVILIVERRRRRATEHVVKNLSGRLISAGEEERKRIARELHDDISQRLSLVSFDLATMTEGLPEPTVSSQPSPREPLRQLNEIITAVHNLSHELHSSKLQFVGLGVALRDLCRQLSQHHHVDVRLTADDIDLSDQPDLALCFYRVAQEALSNAVRHSGSAHVDVRVTMINGMLCMTIRDDGAGFDPAAAAQGLGLATMRERLRLVEGKFQIVSRPGGGTEVTARAPAFAASMQPVAH
jgi:signal transduction histidine kinase